MAMEGLGDILKRIMRQGATSLPSSSLATELAEEQACRVCGGRGFYQTGDILAGTHKLYPCPVCNVRVRDDTDWFAPLRDEHIRRGNRIALGHAEAMAQSPSGWLVLHGGIGTGKTALAAAIESTWWGKERNPRTVATWLETWQSWVMEDDFAIRFRGDCDAPRVVMDNLGREHLTAWKLDRLTEFLDWRYARHLPTVITTEYDVNQLSRRLGDHAGDGDAIADRVFSTRTNLVAVVTLRGPSFRTGKVW